MMTFLGGPADPGANTLLIRRAPLFLRVVRSRRGSWDALDQLKDVPAPGEEIFVYRRQEYQGRVCIRQKKGGGCFVIATYQYLDPQPPADALRDGIAWRRWATAEAAKKEATP